MVIICRNGHYALAGSIILFTIGILSHRISLQDFSPYVPMLISTNLVCTTYIIPWIRRCTREMNVNTFGDQFMVTQGSYQATTDPMSTRSVSTSHHNLNWSSGPPVHPLVFADMDYLGRQHQIRRPDLLEYVSSIDLESSLHQPILNASRNAIVDRVMEDFWVIFDREWDSGFRGCAGTPSSSSGVSGSTGHTDSTRNPRSSLSGLAHRKEKETMGRLQTNIRTELHVDQRGVQDFAVVLAQTTNSRARFASTIPKSTVYTTTAFVPSTTGGRLRG